VERLIVKRGLDAALLQVLDQPLPLDDARQQHVEEVVRLLRFRRHDGESHVLLGGPLSKVSEVVVPDALAHGLDTFACLELTEKHGGQQVGGQIARPDVDPRVLVDLAPEKARPVRPLFADDLGARDE
jgi:hypothetical protein